MFCGELGMRRVVRISRRHRTSRPVANAHGPFEISGVCRYEKFRQMELRALDSEFYCLLAAILEKQRCSYLGLVLLLTLFLPVCGCNATVSAKPVGTVVSIRVPLGLPPVPIPPDNPPTAKSIALGRRLFYSTILSKDNSLSCASCHDPQHGFTDARERSIGVGGTTGLRHAPTLLNVAYSQRLFWDGRASALEAQAGIPMADSLEMNQVHEASIAKLAGDPSFKAMFRSAFGSDDITMKRVENAVASFERTILSGNSAFDQYEYQGRKDALSPAQIRGLAIFKDPGKGHCAECHTIGPDYALFTDGGFHNIGEGIGDNEEFTDFGRFLVTRLNADRGKFKTPTLRNVAMAGPYMHDGKLKTLKDVVDFYAGKGNSNPNLDGLVSAIELSGRERNDLVEFLKSLTGETPSNVGPPGKD
jgi:cytochrome c peroxidase